MFVCPFVTACKIPFQVLEVVDDGKEFALRYMEAATDGTYKWPLTPDLSVEPQSHIVKRLAPPVLEESRSSTRVQYFKFKDL